MATRVTPSGRSMSLTPIVFRSLVRRTGFTGVRITPPLDVIAKSSSSGLITTAPTSPPRRDVILAVSTPFPPRPCCGYSSIGVRLAYPPSVATNTSIPSRTTSIASNSSPSVNRMPITPDVARPIGRSASSSALNRIACACLLTSSRSSAGPMSAAPTSSSSSGRLIAMIPPVRGEFVRLGPVNPTLVREEEDPVVRGRDEEVADDVVLPQGRAGDALATPFLGPVEIGLGALGVARAGDRDDHVFPGDEVFHRDVA